MLVVGMFLTMGMLSLGLDSWWQHGLALMGMGIIATTGLLYYRHHQWETFRIARTVFFLVEFASLSNPDREIAQHLKDAGYRIGQGTIWLYAGCVTILAVFWLLLS